MKKYLFLAFLILSSLVHAQISKKKLTDVEVLNLDGDKIRSNSWSNGENLMVISFWASWCKPCVEELDAISEVYENWQKESGIRLIAISIDDARNSSKIKAFVNGKDWPFEVFNDNNGDLRRAMNVNNIPHTFLINNKGEIIYEHTSYSPGDETLLYEEIKKLSVK